MTASSPATQTFIRKQKSPPPYVTDDEFGYKGYDPYVTRRYLEFLRPYAARIALATLLMFIASMAVVLGPYFIRLAIDDGMIGGSVQALKKAVLLYLLASGVQWVATYLRVQIMIRVGQGVIYDLRARLFEHLQLLSLNFYSRYSVGRVISRVINDVGVARRFIMWAMLATVRELMTLGGILVTMLAMSPKLSMLTFTVLPIMIGATALFRQRARKLYRQVRAANSWVNSVLAENINGVRVVQAFSREVINYDYFKNIVNGHNLIINLKAQRLASIFLPTADFLSSIATGLVIWFGGRAVLGDELTAGTLVAFVLYVERFFGPIRNLSARFDNFQSTMAGGERIFDLLDRPVEVKDTHDAIQLPPIQGEVCFEKVSFRYEEGEDLVLQDINLHVPAGSTIALVGETGAGKSSLIKLLSRFHDPTEGKVMIDGYDLRTVTQTSLRNQMGIVLQEPFLFNGSVYDNIRFGRMDASLEDIQTAASAVGAHEFIMNLREGYHTSVEEGGVLLSVGQRQLISFARALLADPRILILDEATSSVDTQTEKVIQEALSQLLKNRTAFVIAHRLSTVIQSDCIVVIDGGRIIESGTHNELLSIGGIYNRFYQMGFVDEQ